MQGGGERIALTNEDLQAIGALINNAVTNGTNLVLGELDRVEQRIYGRFDKVNQDMQTIREDIHTTKYSNETVELLLKKVTELEKRIEKLQKIS